MHDFSVAAHDEAISVALEHVAWCRARGMTRREVVDVFRLDDEGERGWDGATWALARAWLAL